MLIPCYEKRVAWEQQERGKTPFQGREQILTEPRRCQARSKNTRVSLLRVPDSPGASYDYYPPFTQEEAEAETLRSRRPGPCCQRGAGQDGLLVPLCAS